MSILDSAKRRYSTKVFDASKKISDADIMALKEILRLSPSSVNIQPWHFIVARTAAGKKKIATATQGVNQFNESKILDASDVIVFCVRQDINAEYLTKLLAQEKTDGRMANDEIEKVIKEAREYFVGLHTADEQQLMSWASNQVFLALGNLLLAAADMGIDAVPIEGFDAQVLSQELNLAQQHLVPIVLVPLGYHKADDFNFALPKSRFPMETLFTEI